ncbi:MAG: hypothetical protein ACK55Z_30780, partial [bacterium]
MPPDHRALPSEAQRRRDAVQCHAGQTLPSPRQCRALPPARGEHWQPPRTTVEASGHTSHTRPWTLPSTPLQGRT